MLFAPQRRAIFPDRNFQNVSDHEVFCTFSLTNVLRATAPCRFRRSQLAKCAWTVSSFNMFTCKCASRHSAVPFLQIATCKMCLGPSVFFNIFTYKCALRHSAVPFLQMATSKMLPTKRCFVHFDLEMCFSLQRRTEAGHSVARWTRVTSEVWACVKYVPKQFIP